MSSKKVEKDDELLMEGLLGVYDRTSKDHTNNKLNYNIWLDLFLIIITCGLWIFRVIYRNKKAMAK